MSNALKRLQEEEKEEKKTIFARVKKSLHQQVFAISQERGKPMNRVVEAALEDLVEADEREKLERGSG